MSAAFVPLEHLDAGFDQLPGLFRTGIRQALESPVAQPVVVDKEFFDLIQEMAAATR